ncbi:hypothetical protein [Dactylosporangium sp. NPDC051484]|uniref:hypothetical protein n=1 Tax=Dactylosporangium sp. NPDC051484 TaxID=3154942 RepID=UPI00344FB914
MSAEKVGKAASGLSGLALSVVVAAVVSLPFGVGTITTVTGRQWAILAISAVVGITIPYTVDTIAARVSSARWSAPCSASTRSSAPSSGC